MEKRVAIIGSGPSGIYAAEELLKRDDKIEVVIFEKLPFPYGLVRYGVAPDHQKIKTITSLYDRIMENERLYFYGGKEIPKDIDIQTLKRYFDAIIFAVGCQSGRWLNIAGEKESSFCVSACDLVYWYNGHPEYVNQTIDLQGEEIDIIGQGNVAIDVARILSKTGQELRQTDMPEYAIKTLSQTPIKKINVIGRRGAESMACTAKEIRELGELEDASVYIKEQDLIKGKEKCNEMEEGPQKRAVQKNLDELEVLYEKSQSQSSHSKEIHFIYETTPQSLSQENNELEIAVIQGEKKEASIRKVNRLIKSIGYRGVPLEGVPFDEKKGVFLNKEGRVINEKGETEQQLYVTGWIKRGPSGVIGTNKKDSQETVQVVLDDLNKKGVFNKCNFSELDKGEITKEKWFEIDRKEKESGVKNNAPRVKMIHLGQF